MLPKLLLDIDDEEVCWLRQFENELTGKIVH